MQIYLAPMEGITTYIYRNAFEKYYGGIDKYFTPFLVGKNLSKKEIREIHPENNKEITLIPQILTNQADTFLAVAKQIGEYGYSEVNLNLGCPSGTVVRKKRGAGFLDVPDQLDRFLDEIFEKCPMKISIKTRLGMESLYEWEDLLKIYKKYPIRELIIHTRLQKEFYSGGTHPEAFLYAMNMLSIPLCYNGDICSVEELSKLNKFLTDRKAPSGHPANQHESSGSSPNPLTAIMLGRGAIANPNLPRLISESISANQKSSAGSSVTAEDIRKFQAFHDEILEKYAELMPGEKPLLFHMKELWVYMRKYLDLSDKQLKQLHKTNNLSDYKIIVRGFFYHS